MFSDYYFTLSAFFYSLSYLAQVGQASSSPPLFASVTSIACTSYLPPNLFVDPNAIRFPRNQVFFFWRNSRMFDDPAKFRQQLVVCV